MSRYMSRILMVAVLLNPLSGGAQDSGEVVDELAPAPRKPPVVTIARRDCFRIVNHMPAADVAYTPGSGVRDKPALIANDSSIDSQPAFELPEMFEFNITRDLNVENPTEGVEMTVSLGTVHFDIKTGKLDLDGTPMTPGQSAEIVDQCREIMGKYY